MPTTLHHPNKFNILQIGYDNRKDFEGSPEGFNFQVRMRAAIFLFD